MLDHQFQFALMSIEERIRDAQLRNRQINGSGRRIFRIGRGRNETRPVGRR
jgi:hypothetical protein